MRAAAILGPGSYERNLRPFQSESNTNWLVGLPASSNEADAILIFGGDGTIHRHLTEVVKLQLPVLVVPCGSGNDFARALNLRSIRDSVLAWRNFCHGAGNVSAIDLGVIMPTDPQGEKLSISSPICGAAKDVSPPSAISTTEACEVRGHYFCCVAGIGLDVEIARRANRLPRWLRRRGGYLLSLPPALLGFEPLAVTVWTSEADTLGVSTMRHNSPAIVVAFANAPSYGGGIKIAPEARLDDGRLDVCVVGCMGKARLLRLFPSVYSGSHLSIPEVKYFQTERLQVETKTPTAVYADGEYMCRTPVEVSIERAALRVIVGSLGR